MNAKEVVEEIKRRRIFDDQKITDLLESKSVSSSSDKTKIFREMAGDYLLDSYIQSHIFEVISAEDEFIDLIAILSEKQNYRSVGKLSEMYARSPDLAMAIYEKLQGKKVRWASAPLACLLKGIERK